MGRELRAAPAEDVPMLSNLTIANILLFFAILCMTLSFAAGMTLFFVYSIGATVMAGAVRYQQLELLGRDGRH